jgi:hypothetical protein
MIDRPILFSAPMVRAIMSGAKTQTRRVVKSPYVEDIDVFAFDASSGRWEGGFYGDHGALAHGAWFRSPYGSPGDRLWVRETWSGARVGDGRALVAYRASCDDGGFDFAHDDGSVERLRVSKWRPSIHMPRVASRITLEVTGVRVERLQDISGEDARAEGVSAPPCTCCVPRGGCTDGPSGPCCPCCLDSREWSYVEAFAELWDSINKRAPWASNPWVWVVSFEQERGRG